MKVDLLLRGNLVIPKERIIDIMKIAKSLKDSSLYISNWQRDEKIKRGVFFVILSVISMLGESL